MKKSAKLVVLFAVIAVGIGFACANKGSSVTTSLQPGASPTPENKDSAGNRAAPQEPNNKGGDKTIPKEFVLGKDSLSEHGEAPFNHDSHAFQKYSPDGQSVVGCVECHHTDQPKSALTGPLKTSERDVVLTMDVYQKSSQKVTHCRDCHFQQTNVPEGKEQPKATYADGKTKELNNELAFHINCNTCHDAAFKLRPDLKKKAGFATSKDCTICHKPN